MSLDPETFLAATFTQDKFWNQPEQGQNNHHTTCVHRHRCVLYFWIIVSSADYYRKQPDKKGYVFHAHQLVSLCIGVRGQVAVWLLFMDCLRRANSSRWKLLTFLLESQTDTFIDSVSIGSVNWKEKLTSVKSGFNGLLLIFTLFLKLLVKHNNYHIMVLK